MSENSQNIEPKPINRPVYTEDDLPVWNDSDKKEQPSPAPIAPASRPQYKETDLPVWEDAEAD